MTAAAVAVVAWWVVPAMLAALRFDSLSQTAISGFVLLLLLTMIGSIRLFAGIIGAGVFVLVVQRGLGEMRRV